MKISKKVSLSLALLLAVNFMSLSAPTSKADESINIDEVEKVLDEIDKDKVESKVDENKAPQTDSSESADMASSTKEAVDDERVKKAKEELKAYLDGLDEAAIDNPSIKFEGDSRQELKNALKRSRDLLEDNNIDQAKLSEIEKIPFKKVNGKKQGLLRDFTHKALVDFEVLGQRTKTNPHNNKNYSSLNDNKIFIKSSLKGLKKASENKNQFIKLNYVTDEDYEAAKVDGISSSTPKYNKQKLPESDYKITEVDGGYVVEILNMPENTKFIKPIVLKKLADGTFFENGDLVFAINESPKQGDKTENKDKTTTKDKDSIKDKTAAKDKDSIKDKTAAKDKNYAKKQEKKEDKQAAPNSKTGVESSLGLVSTLFASSLAFLSIKRKK
ncbi:MAG: sortase [Anaerococcus prevotii]|uniref:sortase n=2 Tax=Anaerococcus TaxID=165779 RepID=UPI0028FE4A3D|nr:sortase [Anaerococcus prevotii]MDU2558965.1 sortase [Anaerococcus prevotii]